MNFKKFIFLLENESNLSNADIADMYFKGENTVRDLSKITKKSIPEIYKIVYSFGKPNRRNMRHDVVKSLVDSGLSPARTAELTGYSKRHVLNIIK